MIRYDGAAQLHAAADGPRDHATARSSNIARGPRLSVRDVERNRSAVAAPDPSCRLSAEEVSFSLAHPASAVCTFLQAVGGLFNDEEVR